MESVCTVKRTEGSNPSPSANISITSGTAALCRSGPLLAGSAEMFSTKICRPQPDLLWSYPKVSGAILAVGLGVNRLRERVCHGGG